MNGPPLTSPDGLTLVTAGALVALVVAAAVAVIATGRRDRERRRQAAA